MRHVGAAIAAIVIAPLAWILLAFGQDRSAEAFAHAQSSGAFHTGDFVRPLQYLAAAGLLIGLIATLRFSPLGAVLAGVVYVSSYALLLVAPDRLLDTVGHRLSVAGRHTDPTTPIRTGTTLLLGTLLLVAVVSVGRWRRWPRPAVDDFEAETAQDGPVGADGLDLFRSSAGPEPELAVRYPTRPQPAATGDARSAWPTSPRGNAG
jgi:hypothetical protein